MTPSQLQALKAAIDANPTWSAYPMNSDGHNDLAAALSRSASPAFSVWRTDAQVNDIIDAINWSNYTPNEPISTADSGDALQRKNGWLLTIQTKQMNLQLMLQGRQTVNASLVNVRAGLRDATIQIPSGASGANTSPGGASGAAVLGACVRNANEIEKILAMPSAGSDTTGSVTARVMGYEGRVSAQDIDAARNG